MKNYWNKQPNWYKTIFYVLSLALFLIWVLSIYLTAEGIYNPVQQEDSTEYALLSQSLIDQHSFSLGNGVPETFRTPGYPFFTAIFSSVFGGSLQGVIFVQILLVLATALLIKRIAEIFFSASVGYICSIIFLINPFTLFLSVSIMSDILFIFLYMLFFWLISEYLQKNICLVSIFCGIIAGIAIYVRPMGFFAIPIFLLPVLVIKLSSKKIITSMLLILVIIIVALLPWMTRNYKLTGVFSFSSLPQYNIMAFNLPGFFAYQNGGTMKEYIQEAEIKTGIPITSWIHLDKQTTPILKNYIITELHNNLFLYSKLYVLRTLSFFFSSDIETFINSVDILRKEQKSGFEVVVSSGGMYELLHGNIGSFVSRVTDHWQEFIERIFFCFLYLFLIYECFKKRRKTVIWVMVFIIIYMAFLASPVGGARYRFPVEPFIFMIASAGFISFLKSYGLFFFKHSVDNN